SHFTPIGPPFLSDQIQILTRCLSLFFFGLDTLIFAVTVTSFLIKGVISTGWFAAAAFFKSIRIFPAFLSSIVQRTISAVQMTTPGAGLRSWDSPLFSCF